MNSIPMFKRLLLLTSILVAPGIATAQEAPPAPTPTQEAAEVPPPEDDVTFTDDGELVVLGRFIPAPMRETSEVATFLSSEDLARQGDDNAASALTRLTGLSIVSGRFAFVRGLGDRYSSALLNGSPLPSPEPLRRTVPLDLFPSNILEGASVQKTFSPNYPGEFGGGIIDLRTITQPGEPFFTVKVGSGINTEATGRRGYVYSGGDYDWTGFDDGIRDQPAGIVSAFNNGVRINNLSDDAKEALGESFVNSPLTVVQHQETAPDAEIEVSGAMSWDIGRYNLGFIGVAGYDSSWTTRRAGRELVFETRDLATDALLGTTVARDEDVVTHTWDITTNALGTAALGWDEHEVSMTGLYVHSTTKEAQLSEGNTFATGGPAVPLFTEGTSWYERELATLQLNGEHTLGAFQIDWRVAGARSERDAPYERSIRRVVDAQGPIYTQGSASSNQTRFSELEDEIISGGVDGAYTIPLSDERDAVFSLGYAYSNTVRLYESREFSFLLTGNPLPEDTARARVDYLLSPDNIDPNRFFLFDNTGPNDAYKGGLLVNAAYAAADVEILPLIRAAVGVRWEDARQTVRTFNRYNDPTAAPSELQNEYWLPAATFTWNFAEDMQLRLGYSQTIARPQFRELAPTPYIDPDTDRFYVGNPGLVDSELENYDARLEYYFGQNQFVTAGVFYKTIENPIEEVLFLQSGSDTGTTFINAPEATLYGAELEYRTNFSMPFEHPFFRERDWLFSINYTYTFSEVTAETGDIILDPFFQTPGPAAAYGLDGTQLQGTPENIVNLQFGYQTDAETLTLLVGWVDERILQRGLRLPGQADSVPDVIEDPGVNVDLVYRLNFNVLGRDFTLGLSGRNLLGEEHAEFQETDSGRIDVNTYERGRSFSASLSARF